MNVLNRNVEKYSPTLGRQVLYMQHSRLTRLPAYLTVHIDRFAARKDTNQNTKIMQKVELPLEFDALDLVTDDLKEKLLPVRHRLQELKETRAERMHESRRAKGGSALFINVLSRTVATAMSSETGRGTGLIYQSDIRQAVKEEHEIFAEEMAVRAGERRELEEVINRELRDDEGCSASGLYDLIAIIAHEGPVADGGHYTTLVKKSMFANSLAAEKDQDWYKFDDEDVSVFPKENLSTFEGGGEGPSAYILLYMSTLA